MKICCQIVYQYALERTNQHQLLEKFLAEVTNFVGKRNLDNQVFEKSMSTSAFTIGRNKVIKVLKHYA